MHKHLNLISIFSFLVACTYAANLHPFFSSLSIFRLHFLVVIMAFSCLSIAFVKSRRTIKFILPLFIASILLFIYIYPFQNSAPKEVFENEIKHFQYNLLFSNEKIDKVIQHIIENQYDLLTFQEVTPSHKILLDQSLSKAYPTIVHCDFSGVGGVAVYSKLPRSKSDFKNCISPGIAIVQLETPFKKSFFAASVHLHWPWPMAQDSQVKQINTALSNYPGSYIVGGDFNSAIWTPNLKSILRATKTKSAPGARISFYKNLIPLSIDHIMYDTQNFKLNKIKMIPNLGSDHLAIEAIYNY